MMSYHIDSIDVHLGILVFMLGVNKVQTLLNALFTTNFTLNINQIK